MLGLFVSFASGADAKIWRLNNSNGQTLNPAINADFTGTIQQMHDDSRVQNGDTVHVEQSSYTYGSLTMTKRLIIIGPGYFQNENPKTQVTKDYGATIGVLNISSSAAAGSVISGLSFSGSNIYLGADRLIFENNYVTNVYTQIYIGSGNATNIDSIVMRSNYIVANYAGYHPITVRPSTTGQISNFIFSNNIVSTGVLNNTTGLFLNSLFSGIIRNNTFYGGMNMFVYNMYVVNNLSNLSTAGASGNGFENCVLEYNMGVNNNQYVVPSRLNTNNTNTNNLTNVTQLLIGTGSTDGKWDLQASSPAKGAGKNGVDLGAFGGQIPYTLSGMPRVPNIYSISIAPINPGASSISVTVSAKSN